MRTPQKYLLLALLIVGISGGAYWLGTKRTPKTDISHNKEVPTVVSTKYDELKTKYADSLGATLQSCQNDHEKIYVVEGSSGYVSEGFYYREDGTFSGYSFEDDVVGDGNEKAPPIDIKQYSCSALQTSN